MRLLALEKNNGTVGQMIGKGDGVGALVLDCDGNSLPGLIEGFVNLHNDGTSCGERFCRGRIGLAHPAGRALGPTSGKQDQGDERTQVDEK